MGKLWLVCVLLSVPICLCAAPPAAAGTDPGSNFAVTPSCSGSSACLSEGIQFLDEARARLGLPPYALPGDFAELSPAEQAFVLTDLDRVLYGLRPIPGLTGELDQAAAAGVASASDPWTSDPLISTITSDWGSGYPNMAFAYEAWMYDDGIGSENLDCTPLNTSGCWAHRHDILYQFGGDGALAMGAAAGSGPGYALMLVQGGSGYRPSYLYTWSQAVATGASAARDVVQMRTRRSARIRCMRRRRPARCLRRRRRARIRCVDRRRRARRRSHHLARCPAA